MNELGERLEGFWWGRVPRALSRLSPVAAAAAFDGAYLVGWRRAGALAPLAAITAGLLLGWIHPPDGSYAFTGSLLLTAFLLGVGGLGSGIGLWLLVGFAIGDFVLFPHLADETISLRCTGIQCTIVDEILKVRGPLLISYVLLAQGVMLVPFASTAIRSAVLRLVARFREPGLAVGVGVQVVVQAAFSALWASSLAFAIRPLWAFLGDQPPVEEIRPVQEGVLLLALVGGAIGGARVVAEFTAVHLPQGAARFEALATVATRGSGGARLPFPVGVVIVALLTTAAAAGLVTSWLEAGVMLAALIGIGLVRARLTRMVPIAGVIARRVPMLIRLAAGGILAFFVVRWILELGPGTSFVTSLVSFLVTLLIFAIVAPETPPESPPTGTPAAVTATAPAGGSTS